MPCILNSGSVTNGLILLSTNARVGVFQSNNGLTVFKTYNSNRSITNIKIHFPPGTSTDVQAEKNDASFLDWEIEACEYMAHWEEQKGCTLIVTKYGDNALLAPKLVCDTSLPKFVWIRGQYRDILYKRLVWTKLAIVTNWSVVANWSKIN